MELLDRKKTSPYKFYQFWLNSSDEDVKSYIKIFTLKSEKDIDKLINEHEKEPHLRTLQKALADEITIRVHSQEDLDMVKKASKILFGKSTSDDLIALDEENLLSIFDGVPQFFISELDLKNNAIELLSTITKVFNSKGEARRMIQANSVSINKEKIGEDFLIDKNHLLKNKYLLVQKGKKNYYLIIVK